MIATRSSWTWIREPHPPGRHRLVAGGRRGHRRRRTRLQMLNRHHFGASYGRGTLRQRRVRCTASAVEVDALGLRPGVPAHVGLIAGLLRDRVLLRLPGRGPDGLHPERRPVSSSAVTPGAASPGRGPGQAGHPSRAGSSWTAPWPTPAGTGPRTTTRTPSPAPSATSSISFAAGWICGPAPPAGRRLRMCWPGSTAVTTGRRRRDAGPPGEGS